MYFIEFRHGNALYFRALRTAKPLVPSALALRIMTKVIAVLAAPTP